LERSVESLSSLKILAAGAGLAQLFGAMSSYRENIRRVAVTARSSHRVVDPGHGQPLLSLRVWRRSREGTATVTEPLRIGLIGLGTVGTGVAKILAGRSEMLTARAGRPVALQRVATRSPQKQREIALSSSLVTADAQSVVEADDVDVVVELIGGLSPARELVSAALRAGKDVVTANKALLCEHGPELFALAREHGRCIAFEAAVAGGCPIIHVLSQAMAANQITSIEAILNGTSNFILTEMYHRDETYGDAVRKAQQMGYAEADPALDVDGTDAAQKLGLLAQLAYGVRVTPDQFIVQGIDTIELADLQYADELGYAVKLLATAKLIDGQLEMHTQPTLIRHERPIAQTDGPYNMIALTGDAVGQTWFQGMGAGQMATASAVVSDIIDIAVGRAQLTFPRLSLTTPANPLPLQPQEEISRRYYLRFNVEDRPHVMADITDVLGRSGISIASVIQHEAPEPEEAIGDGLTIVPLVIMTHRTSEGQVRAANLELANLGCIRQPRICMPVSD
jgi:homoserine dehydrogenase